jgi:hypothetical protein
MGICSRRRAGRPRRDGDSEWAYAFRDVLLVGHPFGGTSKAFSDREDLPGTTRVILTLSDLNAFSSLRPIFQFRRRT